MITDLRVWIDSLDGYLLAARILFAFVALCVVCAIYDAAHRQRARVRGPRRKGPTDLLERLDREAPRTRPISSARKSGRTTIQTGGTR